MLKYLAFPTFFLLMEKVIPFAFFFSNLMLELNVKKKQLNVRKTSNLALRTNPLEKSCFIFALKSLSKQYNLIFAI